MQVTNIFFFKSYMLFMFLHFENNGKRKQQNQVTCEI